MTHDERAAEQAMLEIWSLVRAWRREAARDVIAAAIRAAITEERKACAKAYAAAIIEAAQESALAEREACAKVAEQVGEEYDETSRWREGCNKAADAIRARGKP